MTYQTKKIASLIIMFQSRFSGVLNRTKVRLNGFVIMSLIIIFGLAFLIALPVLAADPVSQTGPDLGLRYGSYTGLSNKDILATAGSVINVAMGLLGVVAVVIVLIGGFNWMTSMGNEEKVKSAKSLMTAGLIGLIIILCAYIIAYFVIRSLVGAIM